MDKYKLGTYKINRDEPNKGVQHRQGVKVGKSGNPHDAMSGTIKRDKPNEVKVGISLL